MRRKPTPDVITTPQQAEAVLGEIAAKERDLALIKTAMNEFIDKAKADAKLTAAPLEADIKVLGAQLAHYAEANKGLFAKKRSIETVFGVYGFRRSVELKAAVKGGFEAVLGLLKEAGKWAGIRLKEEVDKEQLRTWTDEALAEVGVKRQEKDAFFYETKEERLQEAA